MATSPSRFSPERGASSRGPRLRPFGKLIAVVSAIAISLAAGGIAVASVAAAEAATPTVTADCSALHVNLANYTAPANDTEQNTVAVTIAGKLVETTSFATSFTKDYPFTDATKANAWSVTVTPWDNPSGARTLTGTSDACTAPTVTLTATQCTAVGGTGSVVATFAGLLSGRSYLLSLASASGTVKSEKVTGTGATVTRTISGLSPGQAYTATATDTSASSITGSAAVTLNACPQSSQGMILALWKSNSPTSLWPQHLVGYMSTTVANISNGSADLTALKAKYASQLDCAQFQADVYADDATTAKLLAGGVLTSPNHPTESWPGGSFNDSYSVQWTVGYCPAPITVNLAPVACTAVGGTPGLTVTLTGLVAGREYRLDFTGGPAPVTFTATGTTQTVTDSAAAPGSTVTKTTITDVAIDTVLGTSTQTVTVGSCPQQAALRLNGTQCTTLNGTPGAVTVDLTGLVAGRGYSLSGHGVSSPVTFTASGTSYTATLPTTVGTTISGLSLTDTATGLVVATSSDSFTPLACPSSVSVQVKPTQCTAVGGSAELQLTLTGLVSGRSYQVSFTTTGGSIPTQSASSSTGSDTVTVAAPGGTTVTGITVTDVTVSGTPTVVGTAPSSTLPIVLTSCPTTVQIAKVDPNQCVAIGGIASLTLQLSSLQPDHSYEIDAVLTSGDAVTPVTFTTGSSQTTSSQTLPITAGETVDTVAVYDTTSGGHTLVASKTIGQSLLPCPTPVTPTVSVTQCTSTTGSSGQIGVSLTGLVAGRSYTVSVTDSAGTVPTQNVSSTSSSLSFSVPAGSTVTAVTVTDVTVSGSPTVVGSATDVPITLVSCPHVADLSLTVSQCTAPGGDAGLAVTLSSLTPGHSYSLVTTVASGATVAPVSFTADSAGDQVTKNVPVAPNDTVTSLVLYDTTSGTAVDVASDLSPVTLTPCPVSMSISVTPCTSVGHSSTLDVNLADLVIGHSYEVQITELGSADGSTASKVVTQTVSDVTSTTATVAFQLTSVEVKPIVVSDVTGSTPVVVAQDATVHAVAGCVAGFSLVPVQCTAPGGSAGLTVEVSDLTTGSQYRLSVQGVSASPVQFTASSNTETVTIPVPAGSTVTEIDLSDLSDSSAVNPIASWTTDVTLAACPTNPTTTATTAACVSGTGSSTIAVTNSGLVAGETWRVEVDYQNASGTWVTAGLQNNLSSAQAASVTFTKVPGRIFRASVVSADGQLSSAYEWTAKNCTGVLDFSETAGNGVESLAFTGADVVGPGIIGLLILQGGIALIGVALIRRRARGGA